MSRLEKISATPYCTRARRAATGRQPADGSVFVRAD